MNKMNCLYFFSTQGLTKMSDIITHWMAKNATTCAQSFTDQTGKENGMKIDELQ